MTASESPKARGQGPSTKAIQRAIWVTLAVSIVLVLAFAAYYVWDRYVHLGDRSPLELGIQHLEEAVRQDPQNIEARVAVAQHYLAAARYGDAVDQANQVLNLEPEHPAALLISGMAYVRVGEPESALDPLATFVSLRKDQPMAKMDTALEAAYYFLGESYVRLGRTDLAILALEAALEISPTDADALYQLGLAYQIGSEPEKALEQYHQAVRFVPNFVEAYQGMATSYATLGETDLEAYARGMEAYSLKDYATAQSYLERAIAALPEFSPAFLGLGLTYEQLGQLEVGLEAVQQALDLNPRDFVAQQAIGRIQQALNSQK